MCHPSHSLHNSGMKDYEVLGEGFKFFFFEQEMIGFAVEEIQPTFLSHGTSPWLIVGQLSASTKFRDCSRSSKMKGVMGLESWVFLISFDLEWAGIVSQCRSKPLLLSPISTYVLNNFDCVLHSPNNPFHSCITCSRPDFKCFFLRMKI